MAKAKNNFIQAVRGICIIAVILIHCINGKSYSESSVAYWYGITMRQFINFPVSVFVFLAAYYSKYEDSSLAYIKKRFVRLVVPYLVWSIIYVAIDLFCGEKVGVFKILRRILAGGCQIQLYFIVVLIQMIIIAPIEVWLYRKNRKWNYVFLAITPLYLTLSYVLQFTIGKDIPLKATLFPAWFLFYWLGVYCNLEKKGYLFKTKVPLVIIFVMLSCFEGIVLGKMASYDMAVSQLKISSCLMSVAVINLILHYKDKYRVSDKNVFVTLGNISYGIYYVHMVGIMISNHFIKIWNLTKFISLPVIQVIELVFVLILSVITIFITKKIIGKGPANKLLGF